MDESVARRLSPEKYDPLGSILDLVVHCFKRYEVLVRPEHYEDLWYYGSQRRDLRDCLMRAWLVRAGYLRSHGIEEDDNRLTVVMHLPWEVGLPMEDGFYSQCKKALQSFAAHGSKHREDINSPATSGLRREANTMPQPIDRVARKVAPPPF